jgi:hypothetical protein
MVTLCVTRRQSLRRQVTKRASAGTEPRCELRCGIAIAQLRVFVRRDSLSLPRSRVLFETARAGIDTADVFDSEPARRVRNRRGRSQRGLCV